MNLSQIIEEVNKDIDDSLDKGSVVGWINRGLDELSNITQIESKATFPITTENSYPLPTDFMKIAFLFADGAELNAVPMQDKTSKGYKVWGNVLSLQNGPQTGEIELYYYKRLSHLEEDEDVPEIEPSFQDLLILYAIAQSQFMDEEPQRQMDAMNRYLARKREYEAFVLSQTNMSYEITINEW